MQVNLKNCFDSQLLAGEQLGELISRKITINKDLVAIIINKSNSELLKGINNYIKRELQTYTFVTKNLKAPKNDKCVIAVVSETKNILINYEIIDSFSISEDYIHNRYNALYEEILLQKIKDKKQSINTINIKNRDTILICEHFDDIMTIDAVIESLGKKGVNSISLATPVMPKEIKNELRKGLNQIFSIYEVDDYVNKNFYYKNLN